MTTRRGFSPTLLAMITAAMSPRSSLGSVGLATRMKKTTAPIKRRRDAAPPSIVAQRMARAEAKRQRKAVSRA